MGCLGKEAAAKKAAYARTVEEVAAHYAAKARATEEASDRNIAFLADAKEGAKENDQAKPVAKGEIDPRFKLAEEAAPENLENESGNSPPEKAVKTSNDNERYINYQEWSQENYYWFYDGNCDDVEDEEALEDYKAAVGELNEIDDGQDVTDTDASKGVDDNTEVYDSNCSVLNVKTKDTSTAKFDPGAIRITAGNETAMGDNDEENAKRNVQEAIDVSPFILPPRSRCCYGV